MNTLLMKKYEEKLRAQFMLNLVENDSDSLQLVVVEMLKLNRQEAKYIISAYYKVKCEILG